MAGVVIQLGPKQWGAELLVKLAGSRRSGILRWGAGGDERLSFKDGRPEAFTTPTGRVEERREVAAALRRFALRTAGSCTFEASAEVLESKLGIDTLGEVLIALVRELRGELVGPFVGARGDVGVEASPTFDKLAAAVGAVGGAKLASLPPGRTLAQLLAGGTSEEQRAWIALLVLGGVRPTNGAAAAPSAPAPAPSVTAEAEPPPAPAARPTGPSAPPSNSAELPIYAEIEKAYETMADQSHYDFLAVPADAGAEAIKQAYFGHAKRWHSDRFAGSTLSAGSIEKAQDIFRRAEEAYAVLSNAESRKSYDYVLDRRGKGLPTDPKVIFQAEGLFRKAQALVRRGEAGAAEPILREVVAMNKGEAEFWVYLGYAVYGARGKAGMKEARELIQKGLGMDGRLDCAYEFLGRIARIEGELPLAQRHLQKALEMNPKNVDAERELRLMTSRAKDTGKKEGGGLGSLLDKMRKR